MSGSKRVYKLIYCYSHEDKELRNALGDHMKPLENEGYIETWHDREIPAGSDWDREISSRLEKADIILLLISSSFLKSDYCYQREMKRALERHKKGEACVIPIILRSVFWKIEPLRGLQVLPPGGRPITTWGDRDEAYTTIVEEIYKVITKYDDKQDIKKDTLLNRKEQNKIFDDKILENICGSAAEIVHFEKFVPATPEEVRQYYEGARLGWPILAVNGDVQRDQADQLIQDLIDIQQLHILCLSGEPGSGKSTLAWRIAMEVAKRTQRLLLHVIDIETSKFWYELENVVRQYEISPLILVDDVFRNSDISNLMKQFSLDLSVTIIATSRSNEIPEGFSLPIFQEIQVQPPSLNEKDQVLQKLNLNKNEESSRRQQLQEANSWLVMMVEMTKGGNLSNIILDNINRLRQQDQTIYHAYGYLCYAGQYDIGIPKTLFIALADQKSNILYRRASRDLIFIDDELEEVRTQHSTIAQQALLSYKEHSPMYLHFLLEKVDPNKREHRKFLLRLLRALTLDQQKEFVKKVLEQSSKEVAVIQDASGSGELVYNWAQLYDQLQDQNKKRAMERLALKREPETSIDWHAYFKLVTQQVQQILKSAKGYVEVSAQIRAIDQIRATIDKAALWLSVNSHETDVRARYLGVVAQYGNETQIEQTIKETEIWLYEEYPENINVRQSYLRLVERSATPEHVKKIIERTEAWLDDHPENTNVRQGYLALVGKRGSKEQVMRAMYKTKIWLDDHPENTNVLQIYQNLLKGPRNSNRAQITTWKNTSDLLLELKNVSQQGNSEQIQPFINKVKTWLDTHSWDIETRTKYLVLVKKHGTEKQKQKAIEETEIWLSKHNENVSVRIVYLRFIRMIGTKEQAQKAIEETKLWLRLHSSSTVYQAYLSLIEKQGSDEQIKSDIEEVEIWLDDHMENTDVRQAYLKLVGTKGSKEQVMRAMYKIKIWLDDHPENTNIREAYVSLLRNQRDENVKEKVI